MNNICINIGAKRVNSALPDEHVLNKLFTPGEIISSQSNFMRGHGTHVADDYLIASVAGIKETVNSLCSIKPFKSRYNAEIGDVVVGRITELQQKRWKVDINSRLDSILLLSSINLPGGELRRRLVEDEQAMRKYLVEGDLISAEVQNIFADGSVSLHTRSFRYGKLSQGVLVKVFPGLIKKSKTHFHDLTPTISIILGNNGYIWIYPNNDTEPNTSGGFTHDIDQVVEISDREAIARIRNCILALTNSKISISNTSILYAYEESQKYKIKMLLHAEAMLDVAVLTQHRLKLAQDE